MVGMFLASRFEPRIVFDGYNCRCSRYSKSGSCARCQGTNGSAAQVAQYSLHVVGAESREDAERGARLLGKSWRGHGCLH